MKEKLIDSRITAYLEVLKSEAPAPGGGAVAALTAAQGAALVMMVANLTIGKKKYAEVEDLNLRVRAEAESLLQELTAGVDEDKEAFGAVSEAFGMPKGSEEEVAARKAAIGIAALGAAEAPLAVMRAGLRALSLTEQLLGKSNANLVSDLYVAALNLNAGILAAQYNVEANLPFLPDQEKAAALKTESDKIHEECVALTAHILQG